MRLIVLTFLFLMIQYQQGYAQEESSTVVTANSTTSDSTTTESSIESTSVTVDPTTITVDPTTVTVDPTTVTVDPTTDVATSPSSTTEDNASTVTDDTTPLTSSPSTIVQIANKPAEKIVNNLSDQIRSIIKHFRDENASTVKFSNNDVLPDPLYLPDTSTDVGAASGDFYNISVHGLSNFTLESVNMLLDQMEVNVRVRMKNIFITGNCTITTGLFFSTKTSFNLSLENITEEGKVTLAVAEDGTIRANQSNTEMSYEHIDFKLGQNVTSFVTAVVNAAGSSLMVIVRPQIQKRIDDGLTIEVNKQLESTPKFPAFSKMSPVDLAVVEGRKYVHDKFDPFLIEKMFDYDSDFLAIKIGPVTVHGLSRFARVGDVKVGIDNRTAVIKVRMLTGRLLGDVNFEFNFGKVGASRIGDSKFSVHHVQFEAVIKQPLNLSLKPQLDVLQLEVGKINVQMDGKGKFDYMLELALKILPDMIRHLIVDALEDTIKVYIQNRILDSVDSEKIVVDSLPLLEKVFKDGI